VKFILLNLIFILVLSNGLAFGQSKQKVGAKTKSSTSSNNKKKQRPARTISLGVINGKAIDLVRPDYPKAAFAINVYGQVEVSVVIDESGKVVSARVRRGHPLLRAASVGAAVKSTFVPTRLGEQFVRVQGTIVYNFLPKQWNWLEIGYSLGYGSINFYYYSTTNLENEFPVGFDDVARFLAQSRQSSDRWDEIVENVVAMIRGKLAEHQRNTWLFEVGLKIGKVESMCCRIEDEMRTLARDIEILVDSRSLDIPPNLLRNLRRLVSLINDPKEVVYDPVLGNSIYQLLIEMKEKYPYAGR